MVCLLRRFADGCTIKQTSVTRLQLDQEHAVGLLLSVYIITGGLSVLAAIAFYWIDRGLFGRSRLGFQLAVITGLLVLIASIVPVFRWMRSATTTIVIGASSDVADDVMSCIGMPPGTATDFSYRRSVEGTRLVADFLMQEEHYLDWMRSKGYSAVGIGKEGAKVYSVRDFESGKPRCVLRGWRCHRQEPDNPDCTETFTFDAETGRVYVLLTLW